MRGLLQHILKFLCYPRCLDEDLSPESHVVINHSTFRIKMMSLFTEDTMRSLSLTLTESCSFKDF